jgi:hypothetical protein
MHPTTTESNIGMHATAKAQELGCDARELVGVCRIAMVNETATAPQIHFMPSASASSLLRASVAPAFTWLALLYIPLVPCGALHLLFHAR